MEIVKKPLRTPEPDVEKEIEEISCNPEDTEETLVQQSSNDTCTKNTCILANLPSDRKATVHLLWSVFQKINEQQALAVKEKGQHDYTEADVHNCGFFQQG
ncbi:hypothetical protein TNCT_63781 [Trichonephila clavata]|uniref:Uncharacterized protein n=1 Tax=Trichonephila clavata TaxID=2740835 RepID=A0A8X6J7E5_TRICU|nr:hypothetical protein TNCT_63781 [Trichonephila clavata]